MAIHPSELLSYNDASKQVITDDLVKRASLVKCVVFDIDGILTDGKVCWIHGTDWTRSFNVLDGHGIQLLQREGYEVAVISGGDSRSARERLGYLNIKHIYLGKEAKLDQFVHLSQQLSFSSQEFAYIGDDVFDVPVLKQVGFSATVPGAVFEAKDAAHYITKRRGGEGAAREFMDLIRYSRRYTASSL